MSDEQTAGPPPTPLPVTAELGQLVAEPRAGAPPASEASSATALPAPSEDPYLPAFIGETHSYVTQYIQSADQKAVFLFSTATALLAFLHQDGGSARWLKAPAAWGFLGSVTCIAMLALAGAAVFAVAVVIPRLPGSAKSLVSFLGIAEHETPQEYADRLLRTPGPALLAEKAQHCYTLATVCRRKHRLLQGAVILEALGVAATMLYFLFARAGGAA